jgi:hypothetical protein
MRKYFIDLYIMSNTILEHKLITLNSRYANKINGTYNSNVIFNFKGILTDEDDIISSNICVMNAQIPISFYTINETNNYFQIKLGAGSYVNITIPVGNYNGNTLITALNVAILATAGFSPTITLNNVNGILTFTYASSFTLNFPTNLLTGGTNFTYRILGFNASSVNVGTSITANYPLNLLGVNRLAIRSNKLAINSYNSVSLNLGITLSTIPVDVPAFSLISYTNQTDLNKSLLRVNIIDDIDISIVDEDNNFINFNNIDWTIALVLENVRLLPTKFTDSFESLIKNSQLETIENKELREEEKKESKDLEELEILNA